MVAISAGRKGRVITNRPSVSLSLRPRPALIVSTYIPPKAGAIVRARAGFSACASGLSIRRPCSKCLALLPRPLPISALLFFVPLYIGAGSPLSLLFRPVLQLPDRRKIPCTARPREVFVRLNKLNASSQRSTVHS